MIDNISSAWLVAMFFVDIKIYQNAVARMCAPSSFANKRRPQIAISLDDKYELRDGTILTTGVRLVKGAGIVVRPAVKEELAATAIAGSQQTERSPDACSSLSERRSPNQHYPIRLQDSIDISDCRMHM